MKVWTQPHGGFYTTAQPLDDQARLWMREQFPAGQHQYYGDSLVVLPPNIESFENKLIDAGGQLI